MQDIDNAALQRRHELRILQSELAASIEGYTQKRGTLPHVSASSASTMADIHWLFVINRVIAKQGITRWLNEPEKMVLGDEILLRSLNKDISANPLPMRLDLHEAVEIMLDLKPDWHREYIGLFAGRSKQTISQWFKNIEKQNENSGFAVAPRLNGNMGSRSERIISLVMYAIDRAKTREDKIKVIDQWWDSVLETAESSGYSTSVLLKTRLWEKEEDLKRGYLKVIKKIKERIESLSITEAIAYVYIDINKYVTMGYRTINELFTDLDVSCNNSAQIYKKASQYSLSLRKYALFLENTKDKKITAELLSENIKLVRRFHRYKYPLEAKIANDLGVTEKDYKKFRIEAEKILKASRTVL